MRAVSPPDADRSSFYAMNKRAPSVRITYMCKTTELIKVE